MTLFAVFVMLLSIQAGGIPPEKGTLCILQKNDQRCASTEGTTLSVVPADVPRAFAWASADGARLVIGSIPAKAAIVSLDEKPRADVSLTIAGERKRGWPLDTRLTFTAKEREWVVPVSAKVITRLRSVRVPPGPYVITIAAEHHVVAKRTVNARTNIALGEVALKPLPVISGRVLDLKDEPIAGAQLVRPEGKIQTIADEQGRFRSELAEPIPGEIVVTQAGFGSAVIPVRGGDEIDLGTIHLGSGHKLALRFARPDVENMPLRIRLLRLLPDKNEPLSIADRELPAKEDRLSFADLSAGDYVVTVEGKDPLQRLAKKFEVKESDTEGEITIAPFRLDGNVRIGDAPPRGGGSINLQDPTHSWRVNVPIDENGRFGGSMWQTGFVAGFLNAAGIHEFVDSPSLGADPSLWEIDFKQRYIRGRIFDQETGQAVEQPSLRLRLISGDSQTNASLPVQADGTYSILAVKAGTYELHAEAPDHVPANAAVNIAAEDATDRAVDLPLARGFEQIVDFVWPSGQAVAGAPVLEGIASDGYNAARTFVTDGAGRLTLNLRRGETKTVYVVPREGSFGIAHVVAPDSSDAKPIRIVVPAPAATLLAEIRDASDKPQPAMLLFRFNGELVPQPVILRLTGQYENVATLRVPNLPAGAYEIWAIPVANYAFAPLVGRVPSRPPLRVGLTAGDQVVKVVAAPLD